MPSPDSQTPKQRYSLIWRRHNASRPQQPLDPTTPPATRTPRCDKVIPISSWCQDTTKHRMVLPNITHISAQNSSTWARTRMSISRCLATPSPTSKRSLGDIRTNPRGTASDRVPGKEQALDRLVSRPVINPATIWQTMATLQSKPNRIQILWSSQQIMSS